MRMWMVNPKVMCRAHIFLEMTRRGYNHKSPLPDADLWTEGHVDSAKNLIELRTRCPECAKLQSINKKL